MNDLDVLKIDRTPRRRRRKRGGWLVPVVLIGAAVGLTFLFRRPLLERLDRFRLPTVNVQRVARSHPASLGALRGAAANGYVVAARRAALSVDMPGRIAEMLVQEGSVVRAGEVVARLESSEYEAAARRTEADVAAAVATVGRWEAAVESAGRELDRLRANEAAALSDAEAAEAAFDFAGKERTRVRELVEKGVNAARELDRVESEFDQAEKRLAAARSRHGSAEAAVSGGEAAQGVAEAELAVAEARVPIAEAARDEAEATRAKTVVRAPFDGVVVLKDAEVGEVVSPNSMGGSNARGSVVTMVDFASLEVQCDVDEVNLGAVRVGGRASVWLDAFPEARFAGRVDRIWPTANRQKATIEVRVRFDDLDDRLRPEMGARVVFEPEDAAPAEVAADATQAPLLVPRSAVVQVEGAPSVFVVERDVTRLRRVELGDARGARIAIEAGLEEGERIVLDPPATLADGDRVRIGEG